MTEEERARKKKQLRLLELQDEDLALEQKQLELESQAEPQEAIGGIESFGRGVAEGLTLGTAPHIAEALGLEENSVEKFRAAHEANPVAYNTGDYGSSIAAALATGGGSIAAQLLGKGIVKVGAKQIGKKILAANAPKTLGGMTKLGLAEGAIEGAARSQSDDLSGRLKDAAFGGTIGAVAPGAFKVAGKALHLGARGVNALIPRPGRPGPLSGPLSNAMAEGTRLRGITTPTVKSYKDMMADPERLKAALKAHNEGVDFSPLRKSAKKFGDKVEAAASKKYEDMSGQAYKQVGRSKELEAITEKASGAMKDLADKAGAFPPTKAKRLGEDDIKDFVERETRGLRAAKTKEVVDVTRRYDLRLQYAEGAYNDKLAKIERSYKETPDRIKSENIERVRKGEPEVQGNEVLAMKQKNQRTKEAKEAFEVEKSEITKEYEVNKKYEHKKEQGNLADLYGTELALKKKRAAEYKAVDDQDAVDLIVHGKSKALYKQKTRDRLINAQTVIEGGEPQVVRLNKAFDKAFEVGDEKAIAKIADQHSFEMGKAVARAKKDLQTGINWAKRKGHDRDEEILVLAVAQLREITHSGPGGKMMKAADDFWIDYLGRGKPLVDNLKDAASPDDVSTTRLVAWAKGSGGDPEREGRRIIDESFQGYTSKNFPDQVDQYKAFQDQFTPSRDATNIGRLGTEGGGSTSRGSIAGGAIYWAGNAIGGPLLGTAMLALTTPMTTPGNYLKSYAAVRKAFRGKSEGELRGALGQNYDKVMNALKQGAAKYERLEDPAGAQDLYESFDFGEGSAITPRR